LYSRIGTGYVYCSDFLTKDEAETEFRDYLINHRDIKHDKKEIESANVNHIEFNAGIYENTWVKNVCAIGMSAGFNEPLEATGIATFYDMAWALCDAIKDQQYSGLTVSHYNKITQNDVGRYAGFIAGHYALAERNDTDYWKMVTNDIDYLDSDHPDWNWFQRTCRELWRYNDFSGFDSQDGTYFIIAGMGGNPINKRRITENGEDETWQYTLTAASHQLERVLKTKTIEEDKSAEQLLSNYEFLTQEIYKNV
jgi:tryptophan halogenase